MINYFEDEVRIKRSKLKKDIRITSGKCTMMLLILGIMVQVLSIAIMFIIKTRANNISLDMSDYLMGYLPCILGDIIAIILGVKITDIKVKRDMFCKNESNIRFVALGAISCIGIGIVSSAIYIIYSYVLEFYGVIIPSPEFNFPTDNPFILTLMIGYVCVLGPIMEEIIFRGFILKSFQKYGNLTAIIVTSILFSMFHLNLVQFVPPILIGFLLAFITIKSRSIVPGIIAHMFNNTVAFAMSFMPSIEITLQSIILIIYTFGSFLGLMFFIKKYGKDITRTIKEDTKLLKTHQKIGISFTSVWSIIYIIFYCGMIGLGFLLTNF